MIRKLFAVLLWSLALLPPLLYLSFQEAPQWTDEGMTLIMVWLQFLMLISLALAALALLIYPPFLPGLRMVFSRMRSRLGTDRGPMYEAQTRLKHLETHADHLLVGKAARELGLLPLSLQHLTRASQLEPQHLGGRFQLSMILVEAGQLLEAAQVLDGVVQEDEQHSYGDALLQLGRVLYKLRANDPAKTYLLRHQALYPGHRQAALILSQILAEASQKEESLEQLRLAAAPKVDNERLSPRDALARGQARLALWKGGHLA